MDEVLDRHSEISLREALSKAQSIGGSPVDMLNPHVRWDLAKLEVYNLPPGPGCWRVVCNGEDKYLIRFPETDEV